MHCFDVSLGQLYSHAMQFSGDGEKMVKEKRLFNQASYEFSSKTSFTYYFTY